MNEIDLIPAGMKITLAHNRPASAVLKKCKCDITGEDEICISIDTSDGEYGEINISVNYIIFKSKNLI